MADSAYAPRFAVDGATVSEAGRHSLIVRVTHWVGALSFFGLLVGGIGILLSHPRFYWGETGGVGAPSLFDLPLPFLLGGPSGWGRYLHFQSAWLFVFNLLVYVVSGLASGLFRKHQALVYNPIQRTVYLGVTFILFPLMTWTGLAMSPAVTSVFPELVTSLGGHQSARTIHFFGTIVLVGFVVVHLAMVCRWGFVKLTMAMITGRVEARKENV